MRHIRCYDAINYIPWSQLCIALSPLCTLGKQGNCLQKTEAIGQRVCYVQNVLVLDPIGQHMFQLFHLVQVNEGCRTSVSCNSVLEPKIRVRHKCDCNIHYGSSCSHCHSLHNTSFSPKLREQPCFIFDQRPFKLESLKASR